VGTSVGGVRRGRGEGVHAREKGEKGWEVRRNWASQPTDLRSSYSKSRPEGRGAWGEKVNEGTEGQEGPWGLLGKNWKSLPKKGKAVRLIICGVDRIE
jgi:hypothetical protein